MNGSEQKPSTAGDEAGGLPPLRARLEAHGLWADKRFGQHFLLDFNITRKIARLAAPLEQTVVVEVGPGPGGLTQALLEEGAAHVVAVERDRRFEPLLRELERWAGGRLSVVMADALRVDEGALVARFAPNLTPKIVANLPYNIATPLLIRWLTGPFSPERMALMFQKEVALRIVAAPGSRDYGRLSVICQAMARPRLALSLPARAFSPPPRVESAVAVLEPLADRPSGKTLSALEQVTAAAFGQRRKMLRSSLRGLGGEALCAAADLSSDRRAEEIDVAGFVRLAQALLREPGSERTLS